MPFKSSVWQFIIYDAYARRELNAGSRISRRVYIYIYIYIYIYMNIEV